MWHIFILCDGSHKTQGLTNPSFSHLPGIPQHLKNGSEFQYSLYILYIFLGKWNKKSLAKPKFGLVPGSWAMDLSGPETKESFNCCLGKKKSHNHHFVQTAGRLSTVMLKFHIYVKVSILINYKTKQPSNLAWNISLISWLCDIGIRFSIHPSVCRSIRLSTFMSKFDIYDKVSILKYSNQLQD